MRVAIAGLGLAAAQGHLTAMTRLASERALTLVAAADPSPRRREEMAAVLGSRPIFDTAEAMIAAVECDVLVVAAHPAAHAELVELGLRHGLHVVCEKPLVVTRADYDRVARAHADRPDRGIVSVLQYRYSPTWVRIARCARIAARMKIPFALSVEVRRPSVDPLAVSPWRLDAEPSGGMMADHVVHHLGLAWTIDERLDVLAGVRRWPEGVERSSASLRVGSGTSTITVASGAPARETSVVLHVAGASLAWHGDRLDLRAGGRSIVSRPADVMADRTNVDALYVPFYRDLARHLHRVAWRAHRTAETLVVGRALVALLAEAPGVADEARA